MAQLPRTDIQFQTGIWWPYHKAMEKGQWHPVRELYTVHDSFVPDRYAVGPVQIQPGKLARVASPVTAGLAGGPAAAIAATRFHTAVMDRAAGTADPSVDRPRHGHVTQVVEQQRHGHHGHVSKPVVKRRKLKKAARSKRVVVRVQRPAARPGNVISPVAIHNVKRTLPSMQRPLPENVRVVSKRATSRVAVPAGTSTGWLSSVRAQLANQNTLNGCPCY